MIWENEYWGFRVGGDDSIIETEFPDISSGDKFIKCCIQRYSDGKVFQGKQDLEFVDCNLINCDLPPTSKTSRCNTSINTYSALSGKPSFVSNNGKRDFNPLDRASFFREYVPKNKILEKKYAKEIESAKNG